MNPAEGAERERVRSAIVNDDAVHNIQDFADAINVFDIKTLAEGIEKQVNKKRYHSTQNALKREPVYALANGKAFHELVQRGSNGLVHETVVVLEMAYQWKNLPVGNIFLWGRMDDFDPTNRKVIEYSTTTMSGNGSFGPSYVMKAGTFARIIELQTGKKVDVMIDHLYPTSSSEPRKRELGIFVHQLTDGEIQKAYDETIYRAVETATLIDRKLPNWSRKFDYCLCANGSNLTVTYRLSGGVEVTSGLPDRFALNNKGGS